MEQSFGANKSEHLKWIPKFRLCHRHTYDNVPTIEVCVPPPSFCACKYGVYD